MRRIIVALAALVMAAGAPPSIAGAVLPGVPESDPRRVADLTAHPWSALAKINVVFGRGRRGSCTGVLIVARTVLTAAHCLLGARGAAPPSTVHVLFGYERGTWTTHMRAESVHLGKDHPPSAGLDQSLAGDWALIVLPAPVANFAAIPVAPHAAPEDARLALAGYGQDRAHVVMVDADCRSLRRERGLILHDCAGPRGTSGAPLLLRTNAGWRVVGLNIGVTTSGNVALDASLFREAAGDF